MLKAEIFSVSHGQDKMQQKHGGIKYANGQEQCSLARFVSLTSPHDGVREDEIEASKREMGQRMKAACMMCW